MDTWVAPLLFFAGHWLAVGCVFAAWFHWRMGLAKPRTPRDWLAIGWVVVLWAGVVIVLTDEGAKKIRDEMRRSRTL